MSPERGRGRSERKGKVIPYRWTKKRKKYWNQQSGARLRVSETELTVRHFDVTNMSHYVTPRGSAWLQAPSACLTERCIIIVMYHSNRGSVLFIPMEVLLTFIFCTLC